MAAAGQLLHEAIQEFLPFVEVVDADPLVPAVSADIVYVAEDAGDPVDRDAGVAEVETVGSAGRHDGQRGHARPHLFRHPLDRLEHFAGQRRGRARPGLASPLHLDAVRRGQPAQRLLDVVRVVAGQQAAVHVRPSQLRQRVLGVAALDQRGDAGRAQARVVGSLPRQDLERRRVVRVGDDSPHCLARLAADEVGRALEELLGHLVQHDLEVELADRQQCRR